MLAQRSDQATIRGVDLLEAACVCARENFARSLWSDRLELVEQSVQDHARTGGVRYDLIVSNPPFFSETSQSPDQSRRLSRSTESLSLFSLLETVHLLLDLNGRFCAVLPYREGMWLLEQAALTGLYCTRETRVYGRAGKPIERLLLQLERNPYPFLRTELVLTEPDGSYSTAFRDMTGAFYIGDL